MIHLTLDYKNDQNCRTPGEYLRYHRTLQGKSTREVAESVGIVPATLVLYENDKHPIKYNTAVSLAQELDIDLNRLLDFYTSFLDYPCGEFLKEVRKAIDKSAVAAERMKSAYIRTKDKAEHGVYSAESSADEYAADRISDGTETAARETVHQLDRFGRKGVKTTKENISKLMESLLK